MADYPVLDSLGATLIPAAQQRNPAEPPPIAVTGASGDVASGAADSGNPIKIAGVYRVTLPTFVDGNRGDVQLDVNGNVRAALMAQINTGTDGLSNAQVASVGSQANQTAGSIRPLATLPFVLDPSGTLGRMRGNTAGINVLPAPGANQWSFAAGAAGIVNTVTAATLKAAGGANIRNYLYGLQIAHDLLGGVTELVIRDGAAGTVIWRYKLQTPAVESLAISFDQPLQSTANTLLEVAALTAVTGGIYVNAQGWAGS